MKTSLLFTLLSLVGSPLLACPLCAKRQPKGFAGITHGTGPESAFDYWILYGAMALVLLTVVLFVWYLAKPDGRTPRHLHEPLQLDWHHE